MADAWKMIVLFNPNTRFAVLQCQRSFSASSVNVMSCNFRQSSM